MEHGLVCSFGSNLSYCGFEMSLNFKENKPNLKFSVAARLIVIDIARKLKYLFVKPLSLRLSE